jgi:hypothetical protein
MSLTSYDSCRRVLVTSDVTTLSFLRTVVTRSQTLMLAALDRPGADG